MLSKVGRFLYRPLFLMPENDKIPLLYWNVRRNGMSGETLCQNRKAGFLWLK